MYDGLGRYEGGECGCEDRRGGAERARCSVGRREEGQGKHKVASFKVGRRARKREAQGDVVGLLRND